MKLQWRHYMAYKKIVKDFKEYAGESFAQSVKKKGSELWLTTETAIYTMYDEAGVVAGVTGNLVLSADKKSIAFMIPKADTAGLLGKHVVLVDLGDSEDATMADVIAEYNIEFLARKAQ